MGEDEFGEIVEIQNEEAVFSDIVSGSGQLTSADFPESEFEPFDSETALDAKTVRYRAKLYAEWRGVRSCDSNRRAGKAIIKRYKKWVKKMRRQHSDLTFRRSYLPPQIRWFYRNRTSRWSGKRSCRGWAQYYAYIEFRDGN